MDTHLLRPPPAALPAAARFAARRGVTLVELLVVVVILMILLTASAAIMQPALRDMGLREGARLLNVYAAGAQARARELGRPVGILIERSPTRPGAGLTVYLCETPAPYAGDFDWSRAIISGNTATLTGSASVQPDPASKVGVVVQAGDMIKFDFRGNFYRITGVTAGSGGNVAVTFARPPGDPFPPNTPGGTSAGDPSVNPVGLPFQIFRKPQKAAADPLYMPGQVAVDIAASGFGESQRFPDAGSLPIIVTFSPRGGVDLIYAGAQPYRPTGPVCLLVGRSEALSSEMNAADNPSGASNLTDGSSLWVTIAEQTGLVTTVENKPDNGGNVAVARQFALQALGQ